MNLTPRSCSWSIKYAIFCLSQYLGFVLSSLFVPWFSLLIVFLTGGFGFSVSGSSFGASFFGSSGGFGDEADDVASFFGSAFGFDDEADDVAVGVASIALTIGLAAEDDEVVFLVLF